jgi:Tol biopolymer transport system component
MRPTPTRTGWAPLALAALLILAGCSSRKATAPRPVPRLTTPHIALTIDHGGGPGIELLDPATNSFARLSPASAIDRDPAISPDGRRIAFVTTTTDGRRLMTMAVDGTDRRPCGSDPALDVSGPHWSPDSRHIVFTGTRGFTGGPNVYTILASGDSLHPVTSDDQSYVLDWSPDGARILFVYRQTVFDSTRDYLRDVSPGAGGVRTLIGPIKLPIAGADYSPDGAHITFCYEGVVDLGYKVEVCNADGTGRTTIADGNPALEGLSAPTWSPDGSLILFSAHIASGDDDLYSATPSSFGDAALFLNPAVSVRQPSWGPKP